MCNHTIQFILLLIAQSYLYVLNYIPPNLYFKTPTLYVMVLEDKALGRQLGLAEGMALVIKLVAI